MTNVGPVSLAETLLDKGFEKGTLRVAWQGSVQTRFRGFGLAEPQGQRDVPVKIGHWKTPPGVSVGGVSEAILNEV
ncbi:hypothetical protein D3C80_2155680 [compost metagenome]